MHPHLLLDTTTHQCGSTAFQTACGGRWRHGAKTLRELRTGFDGSPNGGTRGRARVLQNLPGLWSSDLNIF